MPPHDACDLKIPDLTAQRLSGRKIAELISFLRQLLQYGHHIRACMAQWKLTAGMRVWFAMCAAGLSRARLQAAGGGVLGWNGSAEAEEESVTLGYTWNLVLHVTPCVTRDTFCYTALHCYIHLVRCAGYNLSPPCPWHRSVCRLSH